MQQLCCCGCYVVTSTGAFVTSNAVAAVVTSTGAVVTSTAVAAATVVTGKDVVDLQRLLSLPLSMMLFILPPSGASAVSVNGRNKAVRNIIFRNPATYILIKV